jgi:ankyrin repeat protein
MKMAQSRKIMLELVDVLKNSNHHLTKEKRKLFQAKQEGFDFSTKAYKGRTLLHYAVKYNDVEVIMTLIKLGCFLNLCDDNYQTPLHLAITLKRYECARLLIKAGADVDIAGEMEQTPLHYAVIAGSMDMVRLLVKAGADTSLVDEKNLSPLDYARDEKNIILINFLEKRKEQLCSKM